MDSPLISIIVPVYNAEKTISRAIDSILSHTSLEFELLLVNDGSNDNSLQIMRLYADADSRIRVFDLPNSGVSFARNYGINHARGKYTTFLDADDYYVEMAIEKIISELDSEIQLVIFGYNVEYENKYSNCLLPNDQNLQFSNKGKFRKFVIPLIRNEMINAPWNKIYLTSYLKEYNLLFPPDINIGEDLKFNLSVIRDIQDVKILNRALVNYTVKKGEGLVSRFRPNRFELRFTLIMELKELLSYWGVIRENQAMIDRMLIRDIMAYFMDFYKSNCKFSHKEKLKLINEILCRHEIKEILTNNHYDDLSTKVLEFILNTKNSRFILLSAKILNIKRALR
ncbi:glycosyltransferase family 2 protein [Neobacillus sp. FSL H8-0543]|uniref:glycosyltransferase family 2 protein n=1 Tax=Neobacillus sp. FSL H8-0543 TaxID=2954672 RepID=UPI00315871BE